MKKRIWIWNHYATNMFFEKAGRHYFFARNLSKKGYKVTIFCASTVHNSNQIVNIEKGLYTINEINGISFVFVKTPMYSGNGKQRILNMLEFYRNLFPVSKEYAKQCGKPDIILASSVHPLTLVAGIKVAKKLGVPCICEVRDLWPETLVAYGALKEKSLLAKLLYQGEKWIYKNADKLIFTMEGGKDYIIEKGWDKDNGGPINLNKIYHINNGVDLEVFSFNKEQYHFKDEDLDNPDYFKVVYAGSIRLVNNVKSIVDAAKEIKNMGEKNIRFIIFGEGSDKSSLEEYCQKNKIDNVVFKGFVDKKYIPNILSKSDLNIIHFQQNNIKKYGASLNKMFEYFASGKPTISDCEFGYDIIKKFNCGFVINNASAKQLAEKIIFISKMPKDEYQKYCVNSLIAAKEYDFKNLANKLIKLI